MSKNFSRMYHEITKDNFPRAMEIRFEGDSGVQALRYEKVQWEIDGELRGLRYGENPDQEAAMYRLVNGNLSLGETECIQPGNYLVTDAELLQSGKHPGKINLTDLDSALNMLRYLDDQPACVIVKHNNPSGVALGTTCAEAYRRAFNADRVAAYGGAIAINRPIDKACAEAIAQQYCEVVAAPEFESGVSEIFAKKKNLRVIRIANMQRLRDFAHNRVVDFKSLIDGGIIVQWSFDPIVRSVSDLLEARAEHDGTTHTVHRKPDEREKADMVFGWLVEAGVTSNSVLYVKNGVTLGIGTGEQDRVGVAEFAKLKAYRNAMELLSFERFGLSLASLTDADKRREVEDEIKSSRAGLPGSIMVSDAFFPFRDGAEVGLKEGVSAIIQPGGAMRDWEIIEACNEFNAAMMFTGQRSFRH